MDGPRSPMSAATRAPRTMPKHLKATYLGDQESLLEETRGTRWHYFPGPVVLVLVFGALAYLSWGGRMGWTFTNTYAHAFGTLGGWVHVAKDTLLLGSRPSSPCSWSLRSSGSSSAIFGGLARSTPSPPTA